MSKIGRIPDLTRFDPFKLAYWTLPMTLAWIIWRTPDAVRSQWELYDFHLRDLNREDGSRSRSQLRSLHDLLLSTEDDGVDQSAVLVKGPAARDDLWSKLGSAKLTATGVGVQRTKRESIACTEWQDLDSFDPGLAWPFDAIGKGFKHELRFKNVSVPTKDVLELWPISHNSAVGSTAEPFGSRDAVKGKTSARHHDDAILTPGGRHVQRLTGLPASLANLHAEVNGLGRSR